MNVCCILTHKNKILLVKNRSRQWELPGGKSAGTDYIDTDLVDIICTGNRELFEETGFVLSERPVSVYYHSKHNVIFLHYRVEHSWEDQRKINDDDAIIAAQWFKLNELPILSYDFDYNLIKHVS